MNEKDKILEALLALAFGAPMSEKEIDELFEKIILMQFPRVYRCIV